MPDPIELPKKLRMRGWKVKIYSRERLEPPTSRSSAGIVSGGLVFGTASSWFLPVGGGEK